MSQLLLTLDTSGKNGTVALAQAAASENKVDVAEVKIVEAVALDGGTFSAQLVPQIASLLEKHGYSKSDLSGFVVVSGPGSFTGLRVGLAAIKALAEILEKPIAAVSLLEAVAQAGQVQGRVLATLDAGRSDVYVGEYEIGGGHEDNPHTNVHTHMPAHLPPQMIRECLLTRAQLIAEAKEKIVITSDAGIADALRAAAIETSLIPYPGPALIAQLGWRQIQQRRTVLPEDLVANYIRRTDAEIFSPPKR